MKKAEKEKAVTGDRQALLDALDVLSPVSKAAAGESPRQFLLKLLFATKGGLNYTQATQDTKVVPEASADETADAAAPIELLIRDMPELLKIDEGAGKNAVILYADNILEQGAVVDLEYALSRTRMLDDATLVVYGRKPGTTGLLTGLIKRAKDSIRVIAVEARDLKEKYGAADIDTELPDEAREVDCLVRFAHSQGLNNGRLLGIVKGKTEAACLDRIKETLARYKTPAVSFESDTGIYSFIQALNNLISIKRTDDPNRKEWFKVLPPLEKLSTAVVKAYEEYLRAFKELETRA
jgi:hypothetical protein